MYKFLSLLSFRIYHLYNTKSKSTQIKLIIKIGKFLFNEKIINSTRLNKKRSLGNNFELLF